MDFHLPAKATQEVEDEWMLPDEDALREWLSPGTSVRASAPPLGAEPRVRVPNATDNAVGSRAPSKAAPSAASAAAPSPHLSGKESDDDDEAWMDALAEAADSLDKSKPGQPQSEDEDDGEEQERDT